MLVSDLCSAFNKLLFKAFLQKKPLKTVFFLLILILGYHPHLRGEKLRLSVEAEAAILINADTGAILYEKNPHKILYPASITKVATGLYTLKVYGKKLETPITAEQDSVASISKEAKIRSNYTLPAYWLEPNATHMGIKKGEVLPLEALLNGMLIASANDAANVIAHYISGTVPRFMEELNEYLAAIGCKNTHFMNPHGLHHPDHQTTAYDMALIAQEAMRSEVFRDIVKKVRYTRPKTNVQEPATLIQGNRLLRKGKLHYNKAIGVKTGWTSDAKSTLIAAAEYNGRTLIAVLIKVKERESIFSDAQKMFEAAFAQTQVERVLLKEGPQKYVLRHEEVSRPIKTYIETDVCVDFYPAEEPKLKCTLYWDKIHPPIVKGQRVGLLYLSTEEGKLLQSVPVYASEDGKRCWSFWFKNLFSTKKGEELVALKEEEPAVVKENKAVVSKTKGYSKYWKGVGITAAFLLLVFFLLAQRKR